MLDLISNEESIDVDDSSIQTEVISMPSENNFILLNDLSYKTKYFIPQINQWLFPKT